MRWDGHTKAVATCQRCGAEFSTEPGRMARGMARYCSRDCKLADSRKRTETRCEWCAKPFEWVPSRGQQRFCRRTCYDAHRAATMPERFWARVNKSGECWLWTGYRNKAGYGVTGVTPRSRLAHRVAFELSRGTLPPRQSVCHHCDNPACVRPDHLFLGDHVANTTDKVSKGRQARGTSFRRAKLTETMVRRIRVELGTRKQREIAADYGVDPSVISDIAHGRSWKHVT